MPIVWQERFSLGHKELDEQHKSGVTVANLADIAFKSRDISLMDEAFHRLFKYFQTHFPYEEELMEKIKYPQLEEHIGSHQRIIDNCTDIFRHYIDAKTSPEKLKIGKEFKDLFYTWLIGHFLGRDRAYKPFLSRLERVDTSKIANPNPEDVKNSAVNVKLPPPPPAQNPKIP